MKKSKSTDAVSTRLTSRSQVEAEFAALPQKFKTSAVGWVYQQIIQQLGEAAGEAPLAPLLAALFPEQDAEKARRTLTANYANRAYVADSGLRPLRLRLGAPEAAASDSPAKVWFETETFPSQKFATKDVRPHTHEEFGGGLAAMATGAEVVVAQNQLMQAGNATSAALRQSEIEADLAGEEGRGRTGGLRGRVHPGQFQIANAHQRAGMANHDGLPLAEGAKAPSKASPVVGETVVCLDAMLQWATTCKTRAGSQQKFIGPPAHRLLAMLGDYGTGKTSHCLQFARVVNGDIPSDVWAAKQKEAQALDLALPQAVYIDLAELAGLSLLAELPLEDLLRVVLRRSVAGGPTAQASPEAHVASLIERARAGGLIFVFDGLDELLKSDRSVLHKVFGQLLKLLEPSRAQKERGDASLARVVVSCRTHYFRDVEEQHAFFDTRRRGIAEAQDYLCLTMLPWDAATVQSYLAKRLPPGQAEALLGIIQTTYNLEELASRPVLLAMMSEQVGELLRLRDAGEPITAARLYGITVSEWVQRDNTKHRVAPHHKALLMGALAAAMWSDGEEAWSAERLDRWLLPALARLFPQQYAANAPEALQDDLRTATFIVRPDAHRFSFAHRSFLEYFLARFVWDALALCAEHGLNDADLRALLPTRALNREAQNFLQDICAAQLQRLGSAELRRRALPLWRSLQDGVSGTPLAAEQRANLWRLALSFDLTGAHTRVETLQPSQALFTADQLAQPINLQSLSFIGEQWQDRDLSYLPPLDLRGANLLKLRAHRVRFGRVLCDSHTNFSQALFRDCVTEGVQWGQADRGGMTLRDASTRSSALLAQASGPTLSTALQGPWTQPNGPLGILAVAFHPEGHQVFTAGRDGTARLWDAASGRELRQFTGHGLPVTSLAFHPQGHQVLTAGGDGTARLWDAASGRELRQFTGHGRSVNSAAFHPQGHQVLTAGGDGTARLWDAASGRELRQFTGHGDSVTSVAFHPQGHQVLTGNYDGTARLWEAASGRELRQFTGHGGWVTSVAFHPQGHQVFTAGRDGTARLWDAASGRELRQFPGHGRSVTSVAFHPQGHQVLTAGHDGTAHLWDAASGRELRQFTGHGDWVNSVAFHPLGHQVFIAGGDGTARLWDTASGRELRQFAGQGDSVSSVAFHPQGHQVFTGSYDGTARLWEAASGRELRQFTGHGLPVTSVAFHPQGHQVFTAGDDDTARLWDAASGRELRQFTGHGRSVNSVAFHPQGHRVLTAGGDATARLWDAASGRELRQFTGHGHPLTSVAFHPQGHQVLTAGGDATARLWDTATGCELRQFAGQGHWVTSVAFHPQGHQVLTGSDDGTARLWDAASGRELRQFKGHGDWVTSVAFHPQGQQVLTGSEDGTARLWDATSGRELRQFTGHGRAVTSVAFHPQGHLVLTGSEDGTARLWDVPGADATHTDGAGARQRLFVHGSHAPSTALFDADGNLLHWDDEAIDTWLFSLTSGTPEPIETVMQ